MHKQHPINISLQNDLRGIISFLLSGVNYCIGHTYNPSFCMTLTYKLRGWACSWRVISYRDHAWQILAMLHAAGFHNDYSSLVGLEQVSEHFLMSYIWSSIRVQMSTLEVSM